MSQFVAFKMHMVKRTRHNRTDTTESANRMSIINGFFIVLFLGTKSYSLLDLGVGYKLILVNNYDLIIEEKSLFCWLS